MTLEGDSRIFIQIEAFRPEHMTRRERVGTNATTSGTEDKNENLYSMQWTPSSNLK